MSTTSIISRVLALRLSHPTATAFRVDDEGRCYVKWGNSDWTEVTTP